MKTHTAGPWQVSKLDARTIGPVRILKANGADVPQLQAVARVIERGWDESSANADLIAAAPALFDALKWLLFEVERERDYEHWQGVIDPARAALAKAQGVTTPTRED